MAIYWSRCRMLICLVIGISGCCISPGFAGEVDRLLDEVVAGSDANVALIADGTARYSVLITTFKPRKNTVKEATTVYFDGPLTRVDSGTKRVILDKNRVIEFDGANIGTIRQDQPHNYSAIIRAEKAVSRIWAHPRMQGLRGVCSIGEVVRAYRRNPEFQLQAIKEEAVIRITAYSKGQFAKNEYWVAADQGYGVTRLRQWALKGPSQPYLEID